VTINVSKEVEQLCNVSYKLLHSSFTVSKKSTTPSFP